MTFHKKTIAAFAGTYVAAALAILAIEVVFGLSVSSGGVISTMVAAMIAGQVFANTVKQAPTKREANLYTLVFAAILIVVSAGQMALAYGDLQVIARVTGANVLIVSTLIMLLVSVLVIRFAFPWGARMALKQQTKI